MRINTGFHLSDIQKELLAKIKAAPNPHMAYDITVHMGNKFDDNFASARNTLEKMGIISVQNGTVEIANDQIMQDEGLTDETGELTQMGQQLAGIDRSQVKKQEPQQQEQPGMEEPAPEEGGDEMDLGLESFSLFKSINDSADLMEDVKKFTGK